MVEVNLNIQSLFDQKSKESVAITFDEITFEDKPSQIHPNDVNIESHITTKYCLKSVGIMSSAMDTVTEKQLALAIAKVGGVGIIHRNMSIIEQCQQIQWVKNKIHYGGIIENPKYYQATDTVADVQNDIKNKGWTFTNFPILDDKDRLLGMVSRNEFEFVEFGNPKLLDIMIPYEKLIVIHEMDKKLAYQMMLKEKVKKLPIVDQNKKFLGLYTWKDVNQDESNRELYSLDEDGHFLVGAAVGIGDLEKTRVSKLVEAGCKLIVIDTSHGANSIVLDMLFWIKTNFDVQVIVGNIASYDSTLYIIKKCQEANIYPDGIKVGISIGSICTTRRVTGHGMPQLTAVYRVWKALSDMKMTYIPIIADGGVKYSGDIVKALAVGASAIMCGNIFAGTVESPGQLVISNGQEYKMVRGMGSRSAMEDRDGSRMRYFNNTKNTGQLTNNQKTKVVPEGVEGLTKCRGSIEKVILELTGGVRSGLAHSGANNIHDFRKKCRMWIQSTVGIHEAQPHSLVKILDQ